MNVLQMSISAGFIILLIVVIRGFAINRLPKTMFIALWGIALCRLIIPFSIPSKYSINHALSRIGQEFARKAGEVNGNRETLILINKGAGYIDKAYKPLQIEPIILIWILGTSILTLFFSVAYYKSYKEIRTALPVKGNLIKGRQDNQKRLTMLIRLLKSLSSKENLV